MVTIGKNGMEYHFSLDLGRAIARQKADGFRVLQVISKMSEGDNSSDLVMLEDIISVCSDEGKTLSDLQKAGFTLKEIYDVITKCLEELGFTSEPRPTAPSSTPATETPSAE